MILIISITGKHQRKIVFIIEKERPGQQLVGIQFS